MPSLTEHAIKKRDLRFDLSGVDLDTWHPAGFYVSTYFNLLSLWFPNGERFFISSVAYYRHQIKDLKLQGDVMAFCAQETSHAREHAS